LHVHTRGTERKGVSEMIEYRQRKQSKLEEITVKSNDAMFTVAKQMEGWI
jgi:hypothetical protein